VAVDAFAEMARALEPGITPCRLRARFAFAAAAAHGVTTPAFEAVAAPGRGDSWLVTDDDPLDLGAPVVLRAGVLRAGWEASLARTYVRGAARTPDGWDAAIAGCRPGANVGALPITHGVGRGIEPLPAGVTLDAGMVVAIEVAAGELVRQDVVLVRSDGPELLTDLPA
jgi:hypothetical protein